MGTILFLFFLKGKSYLFKFTRSLPRVWFAKISSASSITTTFQYKINDNYFVIRKKKIKTLSTNTLSCSLVTILFRKNATTMPGVPTRICWLILLPLLIASPPKTVLDVIYEGFNIRKGKKKRNNFLFSLLCFFQVGRSHLWFVSLILL